MKKILLILPLLSLLGMFGCNNDKQKPEEWVLGKWMLIERVCVGTTFPIEPQKEFVEFLPNGEMKFYNENGAYPYSYTYRIDDKYLYRNIISSEEVAGGNCTYEYLFYGNYLKLVIIDGLIANCDTYVYIKQ